MSTFRASTVLGAAAVALVLLPALVFVASGLYREMSLPDSLGALAAQYVAGRGNLVLVTLLGLLPLLLIAGCVGLRRWLRKTWNGAAIYALGATVPVVFVIAFSHIEYWPRFLPARASPGFPHGLELVIGPLIFAPGGAAVGFSLVWIARRFPG
ncbi:MAG: hypothetical protein AAFX56_06205 [Pseudomonadota bacterium]